MPAAPLEKKTFMVAFLYDDVNKAKVVVNLNIVSNFLGRYLTILFL